MFKKTISLLCIASFLSGCAHTIANPVPLAQVGDDNKSCRAIDNEMLEMKTAQVNASADRSSQINHNMILGGTGFFLIGIPWLFMDTGNAATVEEHAAQARFNRLQSISDERKCAPLARNQ
jgi:hypothetical protein